MKFQNQFQSIIACVALTVLCCLSARAAESQRGQVGELLIDVWYGNTQNFGGLGNPIPFIDIVGNVSPSKNTVMFYTLNGGVQETLSLGPDDRRLEKPGDFNADIPIKNLLPGANQVVLTALDGGVTERETVTVHYTAGQAWPLPYSINWSTAGSIGNVAQVMDGKWTIDSGTLKPVELGYDRFVAIGEQSWSDYEITVPITILGLDSSGFAPPSNGCGVGFLMRWPGHSDLPASLAGRQPKTGYLPLGALGWNEWTASGQKVRLLGNNIQILDQDSTGRILNFNTQYIFKMRVESIPGNGGLYMMKVWEAAGIEPVEWDLIGQEATTDPQEGSVLLVAHHVDARFGNVTVVPAKTPVPSTIVSDDFSAPSINTGLWSMVNPLSDASFTLTGTNTIDAWVNIGVPGGTAHEPWTAGNNAPRLVQPANNTDFEVEAKFESGVTERFQLQGIVAQENNSSFIRFEFYSDGSSTRAFVASLVNGVATTRLNAVIGPNGTAPMFMRVKRIGNGWLMKYSTDGSIWTNAISFNHVMNLAAIGPYGGNAGSPSPAHTASIDYFFNTASPVAPEDGTQLSAPAITQNPVNATINAGQTTTFTVAATGSAPLVYQWQKDGASISGATSSSYTTPTAVAGDNGSQFRCIVSNGAGSDTSSSATLTVRTPPVITQHPANATVNLGGTATFTVVATGTAPLSHRWQKNQTDIPGATSASYTTPPATPGDDGSMFRCIVSNAAGSATSSEAELVVITDDDRVTAGLLALYLFNEGSGNTVSDVSNVLPPLNLQISHPWRTEWQTGYLTVEQKTVIRSAGPATKIILGAMTANALTVEAWVRPNCEDEDDDSPANGLDCDDDDCDDGGLARIVSNAQKQTMNRRNFSLETKEGSYIGRMRTTVTDNQVRPNATSSEGLITGELTHLVYTRSPEGVARLYVDGVSVRTVDVAGTLLNWDLTYPLSIANEVSMNRPWYGDLHLVALYGRALSSAEITQNYAAGPDPELSGSPSTIPPSVRVLDEVPTTYGLAQNYPNPFNPSTTIRYAIPQSGVVTLRVYDMLGREVRELVASHHEKGSYEITWEADDLSSGMYLYRIQAGEFVSTRRLLLLK